MAEEVDEKTNGKDGKRETWEGKADFLLSCIGGAVGLGNVWRFPYLCYKNGGGSFLVPYISVLFCAGIPIFFLEISLGQFMGAGGIKAWNICPLFKGIGFASTFTLVFSTIYYIVILAWTLIYIYFAFSWTLPWGSCNNWWNTERCFSGLIAEANTTFFNGTPASINNASLKFMNTSEPQLVDSVTEFWERRVLQISNGIDEPDGVVWELALALFIVWSLVYFSIWKGVKLVGKIVYFTATFPYVVLTILLIRGVTLPGAMDGLMFYVKPDFSKLVHPEIWVQAATQVFYSALLGTNILVALGSYNKFSNNIYRDSFVIVAVNSFTSIYAGFAVFSVLGFMANQQGVSVADVAEAGPGLVFVAYPKAITQMPLPWIWAILFFVMILFVGLDSLFVCVEGVLRIVKDMWLCLYKGSRLELVTACYVIVCYLAGLPMVTRGGMYIFQIFDYYSCSGMALMWICLFETIAIAWFYGASRYYDSLTMMIGYQIGPWLKICWYFITPSVISGLFIWFCCTFTVLVYNRVYVYPLWAQGFGMCLSFTSMICIPLYACIKLISSPGTTLREKYRYAVRPVLLPKHIPSKWVDHNMLHQHYYNAKQNEKVGCCSHLCGSNALGHSQADEMHQLK